MAKKATKTTQHVNSSQSKVLFLITIVIITLNVLFAFFSSQYIWLVRHMPLLTLVMGRGLVFWGLIFCLSLSLHQPNWRNDKYAVTTVILSVLALIAYAVFLLALITWAFRGAPGWNF